MTEPLIEEERELLEALRKWTNEAKNKSEAAHEVAVFERLIARCDIREAISSLERTIAFDPRDWSVNKRDAWIYGVVVGWGDAMAEIAAKHDWSQEDQDRLRHLHETIAHV